MGAIGVFQHPRVLNLEYTAITNAGLRPLYDLHS